MTPKQEAFCREYLIDLNGTQAAVRAGYSKRTANEQAVRILANVSVRSRIQELIQERNSRVEITADRVLKELARIAFFDIRKLYDESGNLKNPKDLDDDTAAALTGIDIQETSVGGEDGPLIVTRKAKVIDRTGALTLAMRHLGILTDKLEVKDTTGRAEKLRAARERLKK